VSPGEKLRRQILRLISDHENGPSSGYAFEAQRACDLLGLPRKEVHKYLDILAANGLVIPLVQSEDTYRVKLAPVGWILLEKEEEEAVEAAPRAQTEPEPYEFHPAIKKVSGELYPNGHYREAALNAYIRVIEEVKTRSGLHLDGDQLMNRAFGCDKQTPVIQFNALSSDGEIDEQRGFMNLFKGVVGLRNLKAHSTGPLLNDQHRAHDYLALGSLLMRVLKRSQINSARSGEDGREGAKL
jgi:uncharacterized protein (TIGR02391 family)